MKKIILNLGVIIFTFSLFINTSNVKLDSNDKLNNTTLATLIKSANAQCGETCVPIPDPTPCPWYDFWCDDDDAYSGADAVSYTEVEPPCVAYVTDCVPGTGEVCEESYSIYCMDI